MDSLAGYTFTHPALLKEALTHPSFTAEHDVPHYERLEYLGDAVLDLLVSELLFTRFPEEKEGALAKRRAALVCGSTLAEVAVTIGLDQHLQLGGGEEGSGGRTNPANLENALEAVLGAIYLDGGIEPARAFVEQYFVPLADVMIEPPKDAKTQLQEWAQARGIPLPAYLLIKQEGPSHNPIFTLEVQVEGHPPVQAKGGTKKVAAQKAAETLLQQLTI